MAKDKYTQFTFEADFGDKEALSGSSIEKVKTRMDAFVKIAKSIDVEGLGTVVSQLEKTAEGFKQYISISKEMAPLFEKAASSYETRQRTNASGGVQDLEDYKRGGGVYMKRKEGGDADTADFGTKHLRREMLFNKQEMAAFRNEIAEKYSGVVTETARKGIYDIEVPDMNVINEAGKSSPISKVVGTRVDTLNRPYRKKEKDKQAKEKERKEKEKENEEKRKESKEKQEKKEKELARLKTLGAIMLIIKVIQAVFALIGKIYNAMGNLAAKNAETAVTSFGLRVDAGALRLREQGAEILGLKEGTYTGALSAIQQKFANIQNVDKADEATKALATILGYDVKDFITMGLTGITEEELLDRLMGGMRDNIIAGKTTLGKDAPGERLADGSASKEMQKNAFVDHLTLIRGALGEDVALLLENFIYEALYSTSALRNTQASSMNLSAFLETIGLAANASGIQTPMIQRLKEFDTLMNETKKVWEGIKDGLLAGMADFTSELAVLFQKEMRKYMDPEAADENAKQAYMFNVAEREKMEAIKDGIYYFQIKEKATLMDKSEVEGSAMQAAFGEIARHDRAKAIHAAAKIFGESGGRVLPEEFKGLSKEHQMELYFDLLLLGQSFLLDNEAEDYIKKVNKELENNPRNPKKMPITAQSTIDLASKKWGRIDDLMSPNIILSATNPMHFWAVDQADKASGGALSLEEALVNEYGDTYWTAGADILKTLRTLANTEAILNAKENATVQPEAPKDQKVEVYGGLKAIIEVQDETGRLLGRVDTKAPVSSTETTAGSIRGSSAKPTDAGGTGR